MKCNSYEIRKPEESVSFKNAAIGCFFWITASLPTLKNVQLSRKMPGGVRARVDEQKNEHERKSLNKVIATICCPVA